MIFNMVGGGGGSSTKSTIIVSIDTGSTVAAYSDSSYTTLVKTASEKSTGEYWLTGLANGTYYIKATKSGDEATTSYTITEYGVYRITMDYLPNQVIHYTMLYDNSYGDATLNQCSELTGGWTSTGYQNASPDDSTKNSIVYEADHIRCYATYASSASSRHYGIGGTSNIIAFSNYDYLFANYRVVVAVNNSISARTSKVFSSGSAIASIALSSVPVGDGTACVALSEKTDAYALLRVWPTTTGNSGNSEIWLYNCAAINADDTAMLASLCGLTNTTTSDILASSTDIATLFSTQRNVKILARLCTGDFMATAIGNSDFMSAYSASAQKTILDANEHWAKFLAMVA